MNFIKIFSKIIYKFTEIYIKTLDVYTKIVYTILTIKVDKRTRLNKTRQVKDMGEMQDKTLERIIEYIKAKGWSDAEIVELLTYLAKT